MSRHSRRLFIAPVGSEWDAEQALAALSIERLPFDKTDGNVQGFARETQVAINPVAQPPT
jgi:hypothetical protein